ncbi:hypothetical protein QQ045_022702 [Rhodiola kirilowii]
MAVKRSTIVIAVFFLMSLSWRSQCSPVILEIHNWLDDSININCIGRGRNEIGGEPVERCRWYLRPDDAALASKTSPIDNPEIVRIEPWMDHM